MTDEDGEDVAGYDVVRISWTNMKQIYAAALAAAPKPPGVE